MSQSQEPSPSTSSGGVDSARRWLIRCAPITDQPASVTRREWLEAYRRAWEQADVDGAVALFTEDAVYRSSPFRPPSVGSKGIREYWSAVTSSQRETQVRIGEPIEAGSKVAVEWWTTMSEGENEITLPGCLVLRFAEDGRCRELREYWHVEHRRIDPPEGWGR